MAYQYPYGDTQQLNLAWFLDEFKALQEAWEQEKQGITGALDAEIARAEAALSGVIEARDQAAASAADALTYRNAAQSASQAAELSKTNAETARRDASNYAVSAAGSAQNASNSAIAAGNSETLAESAKTTAIQQANAAVQASGAASGYAQTAGQKAANAAASATAAAGSATTAGEEADRAEAAADEVADSVTQIATNTSDISDLKESINNLNWNKASAIHGNASGEIASFNDGSDGAPVKITNISNSARKIFAFGYNLLLNEAESGRYGSSDITINDDGTFAVTNKTGIAWDNLPLNSTPILLKAGTYTLAEYDGAQANNSSTLNVFSNGAAILNTRYNKVSNLVLSEDTEITVTFSVAYARINEPIYALIVKGSVSETRITYDKIPQIYKKSVGTIASTNTEIFSQDGVNNIWADNGQISVEYIVNTKMYIDNKITELQATLLENIGG